MSWSPTAPSKRSSLLRRAAGRVAPAGGQPDGRNAERQGPQHPPPADQGVNVETQALVDDFLIGPDEGRPS